MRRFFEEYKLDNEGLSEERINNIKTSVLARTEEVKPMKKRFKFKPLVIAAAAVGTMALSVVTVNAATNGEFLSMIFHTHGSNAFTTKYGEIYLDVEASQSSGGSRNIIDYGYSDDFSGFPVKMFRYDLEETFGSDVPGSIEIWEMQDGGMLGFKYVFSTGDISLLSDGEIQNILDNYESSWVSILSDEFIQFALDGRKEFGLPTLYTVRV